MRNGISTFSDLPNEFFILFQCFFSVWSSLLSFLTTRTERDRCNTHRMPPFGDKSNLRTTIAMIIFLLWHHHLYSAVNCAVILNSYEPKVRIRLNDRERNPKIIIFTELTNYLELCQQRFVIIHHLRSFGVKAVMPSIIIWCVNQFVGKRMEEWDLNCTCPWIDKLNRLSSKGSS